MPLFKSLVIIMIHLVIAISLGVVLNYFSLLDTAVTLCVYFILFGLRCVDNQFKFQNAYRNDPELMEEIMRSYFLENR